MRSQGFQSSILGLEEDELRFVFSNGDTLSFVGQSYHWNRFEGKFEKSFEFNEINPEVNYKNYSLIQIDSTFYAVERGLGQIYQISNSSFKRIDRSFSMQNNFGHILYSHEGYLYSYGGYGFWRFHPYVVRFSWDNGDWNFVIHKKPLPPGRSKPFYQQDKGKIYLMGGEGENGYLKDVFSLDTKTLQTELVGSVNAQFQRKTSTQWVINLDGVNHYLLENFDWIGVDIIRNKFHLASTTSFFNNHQLVANPVIHNDSLFLFTTKNKIVLSNSIAIKDFQQLFTPSKRLYNKGRTSFFVWLFIIVFAMFVSRYIYVVLIWRRRKKTIPMLQKNYLTLGKSILILNEMELELLLTFSKNKKISLDDICKLDCFIEYSKTYRKKVAIDTIKQLEDRISADKRLRKKLKLNSVAGKKGIYKLRGKLLVYKGWFKRLI
ncbi:hypothetical protein N9Z01_02430 [Flavobacteriaceae bacterium]|nr:hypothetical protein [Flavobacteriaceae bacterium]